MMSHGHSIALHMQNTQSQKDFQNKLIDVDIFSPCCPKITKELIV